MPRPGPSVTSGADLQPGSDSLFPSGFTGGGARPSAGSVGTSEIADGSVSGADLNLASVTAALNATYAAVITPQKYGAKADGITDDTAAVQAAITAAQNTASEVYLPGGVYKITAPLVISGSLKMKGSGCRETWQQITGSVNRSWFTADDIGPGSIILQATAATDAIQITTSGKSVDLEEFGIKFDTAIKFTNTGHGINATAPTASGQSYKDHGVFSGTWKNVKVFGHDGNHYGFKVTNPLGLHLMQLRSFGGGGLWLRNESTAFYYGNSRIDGLYVALITAGSSHGILIDGTGNALQLVDWSRPQVWVANSGLSGTTAPIGDTTNMALYADPARARRMTWNSPDFESNTSPQAQVQWPIESNKVNNKSSVLLPISAGNPVLETNVGNISANTWYQNKTGTDVVYYMGLRATPISGTAATYDILLSKDGTNTIEQPISLLTPATTASPVLDLPVQVSFYLPAGWWYQIQSARFQWRQFRYHEVNGV